MTPTVGRPAKAARSVDGRRRAAAVRPTIPAIATCLRVAPSAASWRSRVVHRRRKSDRRGGGFGRGRARRAGYSGGVDIREVMTEVVVTAPPQATVRDVAELMRDRNVGSVVLADPHERPVGFITDRDLAIARRRRRRRRPGPRERPTPARRW